MGNLLSAAPAARGCCCCWLHSTFNCCSCCCCRCCCGCNKRNAALLLLQSEPGFCFKCFMAKRMQELPCNRYRDTLRLLATNCCTHSHSHTASRTLAHTPAVRWWRHRHACVSFSVKLPVVFFCFCLCLFLSLSGSSNNKKQSKTKHSRKMKLKTSRPAARDSASGVLQPLGTASPSCPPACSQSLPAIQSTAHAPTRLTHTRAHRYV